MRKNLKTDKLIKASFNIELIYFIFLVNLSPFYKNRIQKIIWVILSSLKELGRVFFEWRRESIKQR